MNLLDLTLSITTLGLNIFKSADPSLQNTWEFNGLPRNGAKTLRIYLTDSMAQVVGFDGVQVTYSIDFRGTVPTNLFELALRAGVAACAP